MNDDSVGELLPFSTHDPTSGYSGSPAIRVMTANQVLKHIRISHADIGISYHDYSANGSNALTHAWRRVTTQKATVGRDLALSTNASFVYSRQSYVRPDILLSPGARSSIHRRARLFQNDRVPPASLSREK
jgi:hypothetical protein